MSLKPGDWICRKCGRHNFASRKECSKYGCNEWRPKNLMPKKKGDWTCPRCKEHCFASKTQCFKCGTNKPSGGSDSASVERKNGDWDCPDCNEINFGSRVVCRQCNRPRNSEQQKDAGECTICLEEKATHAPSTCGHLSMCFECSKKVNKCPMCRGEFSQLQLIKIFQC